MVVGREVTKNSFAVFGSFSKYDMVYTVGAKDYNLHLFFPFRIDNFSHKIIKKYRNHKREDKRRRGSRKIK